MDSDSELKLISLSTQLISLWSDLDEDSYGRQKKKYGRLKPACNIILQIIHLIRSLELELQPKPESEFMSLIVQAISLFKSMDLDSQPKPLSKLISRFTNSDSVAPHELGNLIDKMPDMKPELELISLIYQILSLVRYKNLLFLCPQAQVRLGDDNILYTDEEEEEEEDHMEHNKWKCLNMKGFKIRIAGEGTSSSYFLCYTCYGNNHEKATDEIKHSLHPKHSLKLVFLNWNGRTRTCYCCDEYLSKFIYCCLACDFAMKVECLEKPLVLSLPNPKRHEHPLALFPRATSLICDICALVDSSYPTYICVPCNFVVHQRCINLPSVIRISRHPQHRISFTPSFNQGIWSCGVCRKEIHNDYGGYSCTKNGCSYAAHSKCATQRNVWDGEDLEGVPEEDIGDVEPFVRISDGIIQHFSHQEHHLRLDENTDRDYDDNKLCQACITPVYFGNLYSCMQCDFVLHEECANLARKMYHPIHPHLLTLVRKDVTKLWRDTNCSACPSLCTVGLSYDCCRQGCFFQLHVQCGVVSEPLLHASHMHPLFLTSKPGEKRECSVCKQYLRPRTTSETFNCIECDFSLCFGCATLPQKVRYKHDKHTFVLSYGNEETSIMASWCEVCETKIDTKKGFYMCDEDCCVTLHIKCTIGDDLYMQPGSSWSYGFKRVYVVPNKQQMTRPKCSRCKRRFPNASFQLPKAKNMEGLIFCSTTCMYDVILDINYKG